MLIFVVIIVCSVVILWRIIVNAQNKFIFIPEKRSLSLKRIRGQTNYPVNEYFIKTTDGEKVHALHYLTESPNTILFAHGNAGNISSRVHMIDTLAQFGSVLMFDYRGYGKSTGEPSEEGLYTDIESVWSFMLKKLKIEPQNTILYGESLGCAIVSHLCLKVVKKGKLPKLMILQSGFSSLEDIATDLCPGLPTQMLTYSFNTADNVKKVKDSVPIVVVHSPNDEIIKMNHALRLILINKDIHFLRIKGGHNTPIYNENYFTGIKKLI